jgi:hypothetical protein
MTCLTAGEIAELLDDVRRHGGRGSERNMQLDVTGDMDIREACLQVTRHYYDQRGQLAYQLFELINASYFDNELPWPLIIWALTAHGKCLGYTMVRSDAPIVTLHPSIMGGTEKDDPWGIPPAWLNIRYAFDVLVHELMHVSVACRLGGWRGHGDSSHNNTVWVEEVNRLAPLLGFSGIKAGVSYTKRQKIEGSTKSRVVRTTDGSVPFDPAVTRFPSGLREHLEQADAYYRHGTLPVQMAQACNL